MFKKNRKEKIIFDRRTAYKRRKRPDNGEPREIAGYYGVVLGGNGELVWRTPVLKHKESVDNAIDMLKNNPGFKDRYSW